MTQNIDLNQLKQYNLITYILYLVGFVVGITGLIAIIMNYVNAMKCEEHGWKVMSIGKLKLFGTV